MMGEPLVKGLYLQSALDLVKERGGEALATSIARELQIERIWSFRDYPQRTLMRVAHRAAACFADVNEDEKVRQFGIAAYQAFAQTLVGRVGIRLAQGSTPTATAHGMERMHKASTSSSTLQALDVSDDGFRLHYLGCIHPWFQLGLVQAALSDALPHDATRLTILNGAFDDEGAPLPACEFDLLVDARGRRRS